MHVLSNGTGYCFLECTHQAAGCTEHCLREPHLTPLASSWGLCVCTDTCCRLGGWEHRDRAWPESSAAQRSLPPGPSLFLTSLEVRADLQTCLCGVPGGAGGLCFSLVLLGCPEDKGEKGP